MPILLIEHINEACMPQKRTASPRSAKRGPRRQPKTGMPSPSQPKRLKSLSFYLGRAYYGYIGLVERTLQLTRLDGHLRPGMAHILLVLFERDNCIIKEIAKRVELSPSTLTGMLNRMEEAGLIRRHSDSDDRRAIRIRLTSRGKSLKHRMTRAQAIVEATLQGDLTKQELDAVKTGLARVIAAIRDAEESP